MNKQEIFDRVVRHLAQQGRKAVRSNGICALRSSDGLACAVGCLIPDEEYDPAMEGGAYRLAQKLGVLEDMDPWSNHLNPALRDRSPVTISFLTGNVQFLADLQATHDTDWAKGEMVARLHDVAKDHGLDPAILYTLSFPENWV